MSHFYGQLQGSRGKATRCGTRTSGIEASAQSWTGSVTVSLDDQDGVTVATIRVSDGSSLGGRTIWSGPLAELLHASSLLTSERAVARGKGGAMQRLFEPERRTNRQQLERRELFLELKYRDYHSALDFTLHSSPPVTHEPQVLFEPPAPLVPTPQDECLF